MDIHPRAANVLNVIACQYKDILGDNLVGLYVHGSLAFGCFHWSRSDIDFITVIKNKIDRETKIKLLDCLEKLHPQCPQKGVEMSVILRKHCRKPVYPTPYELHFSPSWRDRYLNDPASLCTEELKTDPDLASYFTVLKYTGIVSCGAPIDSVFGPVAREYFLDSILTDIREIGDGLDTEPVSVILNLCRTLAYLEEDLVLSKGQGGRWALKHLEEPWLSVVKEAERCYAIGGSMAVSKDRLLAFRQSMLDRIMTKTNAGEHL